METHEDRLRCFQNGSPVEIIETLLNSVNNFFNSQIRKAASDSCWDVVLLGVHAVALTIADGLLDQRGSSGYRAFLAKFVPDTRPGYDCASIAKEIHDWRNAIAHRWLSHQGHQLSLDTTTSVGWMRTDSVLHFNPAIYADSYLSAFGAGARIWDWEQLMTVQEAEAAKKRLIDNYMRGS